MLNPSKPIPEAECASVHIYQQLTEIDNWLRLTIDWDWQSTEIDNWLRSTIDWDRQLTEIDNWLILIEIRKISQTTLSYIISDNHFQKDDLGQETHPI